MSVRIPGDRPLERAGRRGATETILMVLEAFLGIAAVAGGGCLMARPDGSLLALQPGLLKGSPFADYAVPGMALAVVVGGGMFGGALLLGGRRRYALEVGMLAGGTLVLFEVAQVAAIGPNPQQAIYGGLGAIVLGMAARRRLAASRPRRHVRRRTRA